MRSTIIHTATAFAVLAAGTLGVGPANANHPPRPYVGVRSSVVIPLHGCQSTAKWVNVIYSPGTRVDSSEVVSVRKSGYTFPLSQYRVCGYMGSGTYTVKTRVRWSVSRKKTKRVRVYSERDVDVPFTCTLESLPDPPTANDEWDDSAVYRCAYDDGREWDEEVDYSRNPEDLEYYERYYWVNNLPTGWISYLVHGQLDVEPANPYAVSELPQTFTGATRESESYFFYRQKRVLRWIKKPTLTVNRVVQVTVR